MRLLRYPWGANLGDTLQSYVFERYMSEYLGNIPIGHVGRDFPLSTEFAPYNDVSRNSERNVIITGWLTQDPSYFLNYQHQIMGMIGIHLTDQGSLSYGNFGITSLFLSRTFREEFSKIRVSTRDTATSEFLSKYGFQAPFAGCVSSLTSMIDLSGLPKLEPIDVLCVDLESAGEDLARTSSTKTLKSIHTSNRVPEIVGEVEKTQRVKNLFAQIISAEHILTSRLHVALPAIALGKKTLLVSKRDSRFGGLEDFLNMTNPSEDESILDIHELILKTDIKPKSDISIMQKNIMNQIIAIQEQTPIHSKVSKMADYERQVLSEISEELLETREELLNEINIWKTRNLRLERQLTETESSTSWRITSPVRFLSNKARTFLKD